MITKEQYRCLRSILDKWSDPEKPFGLPIRPTTAEEYGALHELVAEYEAANPPKPEVKCPACGHQMVHEKDLEWWHCDNVRCLLHGPLGDPDGSKVMALGKRKLPLERNRQYHVYNGRAHEVLMYNGIKTEGDPIDISEFFE